jgi:hypothetical protein
MSYYQPTTVTSSASLDDLVVYGYNYFVLKITSNTVLSAPSNYLNEGLCLSFARKDTNVAFTCSIFGNYLLPNQSMDLIYHDGEWIKNKYSLV